MTAALIIAAGKRSRREPFTPGMAVGSISAIERIVLLFQQAGIKRIVVCGEDEEVKKLVPSMDLVFLPCAENGEMFQNIQSGISYLEDKAGQILVCHVDSPYFSVQTVETLLASPGTICIPSHKGKKGHPILLREDCFDRILSFQGEQGLRGAVRASGFEPVVVEVPDQGILANSEEFALAGDDLGKLRLSYQFRIGREAVFYGPGVHQLLKLTQELHSLSEACKYMGISYSKGRKIVQTMEEQTGFPVLLSQQGGRGGGYSQLTDPAADMTRRYDAFLQEADGLLRNLFEKHFLGEDQ